MPRFLIDENFSPLLASHLCKMFGFDDVHVRDASLLGASDEMVLARAVLGHRIVVTSNADDCKKLGAAKPDHPGLAILRDAVSRDEQLRLGALLADEIEVTGATRGRLFEIDGAGKISHRALP